MEGLTVGRIVHFVWDGLCKASVVTHVWDKNTGLVNLFVFRDPSANLITPETPTSVVFSDIEHRDGTWHWIEKA